MPSRRGPSVLVSRSAADAPAPVYVFVSREHGGHCGFLLSEAGRRTVVHIMVDGLVREDVPDGELRYLVPLGPAFPVDTLAALAVRLSDMGAKPYGWPEPHYSTCASFVLFEAAAIVGKLSLVSLTMPTKPVQKQRRGVVQWLRSAGEKVMATALEATLSHAPHIGAFEAAAALHLLDELPIGPRDYEPKGAEIARAVKQTSRTRR